MDLRDAVGREEGNEVRKKCDEHREREKEREGEKSGNRVRTIWGASPGRVYGLILVMLICQPYNVEKRNWDLKHLNGTCQTKYERFEVDMNQRVNSARPSGSQPPRGLNNQIFFWASEVGPTPKCIESLTKLTLCSVWRNSNPDSCQPQREFSKCGASIMKW